MVEVQHGAMEVGGLTAVTCVMSGDMACYLFVRALEHQHICTVILFFTCNILVRNNHPNASASNKEPLKIFNIFYYTMHVFSLP